MKNFLQLIVINVVFLTSVQTVSATVVTSSFYGQVAVSDQQFNLYNLDLPFGVFNILVDNFAPTDFDSPYFIDADFSVIGAIAYENDFAGVNPYTSQDWILDYVLGGELFIEYSNQTQDILPFFIEGWIPISDFVGDFSLMDLASLLSIVGNCDPVSVASDVGFCGFSGDFEQGALVFGVEQPLFTDFLNFGFGIDDVDFFNEVSYLELNFEGALQLKTVPAPAVLTILLFGLAGTFVARRRA
jgi:hypothetical protein